MMVSESENVKFVFCPECGKIMVRQPPSKEQTATGTKDIFECMDCGTLLFFGQIVTSHTGAKLDQFTVTVSFNPHSSEQTVREPEKPDPDVKSEVSTG